MRNRTHGSVETTYFSILNELDVLLVDVFLNRRVSIFKEAHRARATRAAFSATAHVGDFSMLLSRAL
jgi:hypothetical protein